jgi:putative DNA primase/helicase
MGVSDENNFSFLHTGGDCMIQVPTEMIEYKQWVLWRRVEVYGRTAKLPISAWSGKAAACDKPQTWTTFQHARVACKQFNSDGIGFVFTDADPFCGIDLDKCRKKNGWMSEEAFRLIRHMSSYAEISPSGNGIHIIIRAQLGTAGRRTAGVEVYAAGRYFTMTGRHLDGTPDRIEQRQRELDDLLQERFPSESEASRSKTTPRLGLSDSALIDKALSAKSGARFRRLWYGDTSDYDGDHSRADAALCRMLSFWTGGDPERIDRLFRLSGLMRGKWDRRTGRETYGARTIRIISRR